MKRDTFFIKLVVILILLAGPFGHLSLAPAKPRLVCYCCIDAATGKPCVMISCSGCKAKAGWNAPRLAPEMVLRAVALPIQSDPVYVPTESIPLPEAVYLEVPVKPPKAI